MHIDFQKALGYPYREANRVNGIVYPGLVYLVQFVISFAIGILVMLLQMLLNDETFTQLSDSLQSLLNFPFSILTGAVLMGFQWHFLARFQQEGAETEVPSWERSVGDFLKDGLKLYLFYFICGAVLTICLIIPLVLMIITLGITSLNDAQNLSTSASIAFILFGLLAMVLGFFLAPFFWAPQIHTAQDRRLSRLFDISRAVRITLPVYGSALKAELWIILVGVMYLLGSLILCCTCVGIAGLPFASAASTLTIAHLMAQAFNYSETHA